MGGSQVIVTGSCRAPSALRPSAERAYCQKIFSRSSSAMTDALPYRAMSTTSFGAVQSPQGPCQPVTHQSRF